MVTAVNLGVLLVVAAGEGMTPTRKDRGGDRGRGSPSLGLRSFRRAESTRAPRGSPGWGPPLASLGSLVLCKHLTSRVTPSVPELAPGAELRGAPASDQNPDLGGPPTTHNPQPDAKGASKTRPGALPAWHSG